MAKCDICGKGVTFGIQVSHSHRLLQPYLEAERSSCKGSGGRYSPPYQRMYSVPPLRQGNPRDLICRRDTVETVKALCLQSAFLLPICFEKVIFP